MKTLVSFLFLIAMLTSCTTGESKPAAENLALPKTINNLSYGSDSLQVMDVYLPANRSATATKALVLIHGGGWNSGSKAEFASYIDSFKTRLPGYAIFNLNYRLVDGNTDFSAPQEDVKKAIDLIVERAGQFGVNKVKLALLGVSAGAHLALLQANKHKEPRIRAVVDYFGPTDLKTMYQRPWHQLVPLALQMLTGTTPTANPRLYAEASPVNFITPQSPPTLLLHGGRDEVVDVSQSKLLAAKLEAAGVKHKLVVYPYERHGRWYGQPLVSSFDEIQRFLQETLQ